MHLSGRFGRMVVMMSCVLSLASAYGQRLMENLGRGIVAIRASSTQAYIGWRLLGTDPADVAFNIYRSANGATATKLNSSVISTTTNFIDTTANFTVSNAYSIRPVINGVEQSASAAFTLPANTAIGQYLSIPLQIPVGGTTPDGVTYTYSANDCSVGDLDGDGEYEIIVKWDPSNSKDNSNNGYTGKVYLDAYKLNGTRLWRIDLGINIRAGAHYTQFMVYDLDGDGKAEIACKTAPGTLDGTSSYVGGVSKWQNTGGTRPIFENTADYRNSSGYILSGAEFLTLFDGLTGSELVTTSYVPLRGTVSNWGDTYGNRVDRFLACVAYLDGIRPSLVMCRGYYTRTALAAWDWIDGQLTQRWIFDTGNSTTGPLSAYRGQGAHSVNVADVDGDGKDEIIYGACTIDDDGTGLYSTGLNHGDALHTSDMDPTLPGLEVFMVHESGSVGGDLHDARTGEIITTVPGSGDVGRGCAFDLESSVLGYEMWTSGNSDIYNVNGNITGPKHSNMFINFGAWWDADLSRELLDSTVISDWVSGSRSNFDLDPATSGTQQYAPGCSSNNGTKSTPCLSADLFGDWREEVIWRTTDSSELRIFTTRIAAGNRIVTLMHNPQYRLAIAWQNVAYNQPPHPGFYLGAGMSNPPRAPIWNGDLIWSGNTNGSWDSTTLNWTTRLFNGSDSAFTNTKSVLFGFGGANPNILLSGTISPSQIVVHNPSGKDYTFGGTGTLSGTTTLVKAGEGALVINTSNSFTGSTSVQQGTLTVNGSLSSSPVTVEGYGTLSGSGSLGQSVSIAPRAHVSPGTGIGATGTLTIGGALTLNGSILDFDLSTPAGTSDKIATQGNLTFSGSNSLLIRSLSGTLTPGTYTLITYTGTLSGAANLTWTDTTNSGLIGTLDTSTAGQIRLILLTPFQAWRKLYFGDSANSGNETSTADYDHDGISNLVEYASGTNPTQNTPVPYRTEVNANSYLQITFNRIADPMLTYTVQVSENLETWSDIWTSTSSMNVADTVTVSDEVPLPNSSRRFLRLSVSTTSP
ncbi:MAG: autotransporter-associated beta strand repeat-containing protein [Luteolibacter sp.]